MIAPSPREVRKSTTKFAPSDSTAPKSALSVHGGLGDVRDGTLITLLALNGLPISEVLSANIDDLSTETGRSVRDSSDCGSAFNRPWSQSTQLFANLVVLCNACGHN